MKIFFGDLSREYSAIKKEIDHAIQLVLNSGRFILGEADKSFEQDFASYCGSKYCVSCASGTEAIALSLMALGVGSGDEVVTTNITAVPTISAVSMTGAKAVLVDTKDADCLLDPDKIVAKINSRTKVILPVHLYGQVCDLTKINRIAKQHNLYVIEDACQAHGSTYKNKKAGSLGDLGCFSFYPSKNLGCYGDGGAVVTNSARLNRKLIMLRNYGQSKRYFHDLVGINSRLDEIQASILKTKLKHLDIWNKKRRQIAEKYNFGIKNPKITMLSIDQNTLSNYHLYVIKVKSRQKFIDFMSKAGIQLMIHYPISIHRQKAYANLNYPDTDFPVSLKNSRQIVSLPMYPYLTDQEIKYIIKTANKF